MLINSVTEIYFSPTNTTKKVVNAISKGLGVSDKQIIDITKPENRSNVVPVIEGDMAIIGVPVYEERVPKIVSEFLRKLNGRGKPVVIVGVYGNIAEGIVLNELNDIVTNTGFKVVGAATFIGEHSSFVTDNGNYIVDLHIGKPMDIEKVYKQVTSITGVLEIGLFLNMCNRIIVGYENGVRVIENN